MAADGVTVGPSYATERVVGWHTPIATDAMRRAGDRARVVVIGTMAPAEQAQCLARVRSNQVVVAQTDLAWIRRSRDEVKSVLTAVDVAVLTTSELRELIGPGEIGLAANHLLAGRPRVVVATAGERGAMVFEAQRQACVPAFRTRVVDPTGAGDAFTGAFAGYIEASGHQPVTCAAGNFLSAAAYASAAASVTVEGVGIDAIASTAQSELKRRAEAVSSGLEWHRGP